MCWLASSACTEISTSVLQVLRLDLSDVQGSQDILIEWQAVASQPGMYVILPPPKGGLQFIGAPVQPDGRAGPMPGFRGAPWALIFVSKPQTLVGMPPSQVLPACEGATFWRNQHVEDVDLHRFFISV